ncbi:MAG: ATPase, partial [candidate division WS6 bacterium GW2011_GWC1_36_11]
IHFVLKENISPDDFKSLGKLTECSGNEGTLVVSRERVSDVSKELLNMFEVVDLDISEPNLETVIKGIFEGGYKI